MSVNDKSKTYKLDNKDYSKSNSSRRWQLFLSLNLPIIVSS